MAERQTASKSKNLVRKALSAGIHFHPLGSGEIIVCLPRENGLPDMKLAPFAMKLCNDANAPAIAELMQSEHVPTPFHVTGKEQHSCWCEPEMTAMCPDCEGTGYRNKMPCRGCGCRGRFTVENPALADSIRHRTIPVREI